MMRHGSLAGRRVARATMRLAVLAALLGLACAPTAAPSPTATPSKPSPAASPGASPSPSPSPSPAAAAAAKPAEAAAATFDERAVADFYRGKTIRIIVGFAPGGSFDLYSRLLAKHMPQYIPGNPNIIAENRPGAASAVAANAVYSTEAKDGTVIGSINEFLVLQHLLRQEGMQFDPARFNWLGASVDTLSACLARSDVGINSVQDIMNGKELVVGTTGLGAATHDTPAVLNAALGTNFKLVSGYAGISTIQLALESREVDGYCVSWDAMLIVGRQMLEGNNPTAKVFLIMGDKPLDHPYLQGVPAAETLAKTDEARQLLRAVHAPSQMSKPFAVAPEVPRDRVEALRRAMEQAFANPQLKEEASRSELEVAARNGQEVTQIVQELLGTRPEIIARLKDILK
jgi:tripartite-type tricarboxylate transporter receptor subunit TctC